MRMGRNKPFLPLLQTWIQEQLTLQFRRTVMILPQLTLKTRVCRYHRMYVCGGTFKLKHPLPPYHTLAFSGAPQVKEAREEEERKSFASADEPHRWGEGRREGAADGGGGGGGGGGTVPPTPPAEICLHTRPLAWTTAGRRTGRTEGTMQAGTHDGYSPS